MPSGTVKIYFTGLLCLYKETDPETNQEFIEVRSLSDASSHELQVLILPDVVPKAIPAGSSIMPIILTAGSTRLDQFITIYGGAEKPTIPSFPPKAAINFNDPEYYGPTPVPDPSGQMAPAVRIFNCTFPPSMQQTADLERLKGGEPDGSVTVVNTFGALIDSSQETVGVTVAGLNPIVLSQELAWRIYISNTATYATYGRVGVEQTSDFLFFYRAFTTVPMDDRFNFVPGLALISSEVPCLPIVLDEYVGIESGVERAQRVLLPKGKKKR
ncbi:MAG: hypothetical protein DMF61_24465 [Blastocatellia bacterium AA13]|nr:MAG: hypothetical protein DMF61_24465 [Blastocatellia bacterium AA13]